MWVTSHVPSRFPDPPAHPPHRAVDPRLTGAAAPRLRWSRTLVLLLPVLMFGQVFHYVKAFPPLWALSKLFPVLSTPLILVLLRWPRPAAARQLTVSFAWLLIVPSVIAIWTFQQSFPVGLTAQIKLLPILYFFSFLGLLRLVRPTLDEIAGSFLLAAAGTFAVLIAIWLLAPQSWYLSSYDIDVAPLLTVDNRGNRIRMPMYFGLIGLFYCYRRWLAGDGWRWLPPVAIACLLLVVAVRTRTTVLGVAAVIAITAFLAAGARLRIVLVALIPLALAALFSVPYLSTVFATDRASGFDTRWITTVKAIDFLGTDPLAWLFGVGTISPLDRRGLMQYFNHFFFLADIAWLGVVFEFGLIGAALIAAMPLRGLWLARQARAAGGIAGEPARDDAFLAALQDALVYALLTSSLSPITLAPGEVTTIMAVMVYARALRSGTAGSR